MILSWGWDQQWVYICHPRRQWQYEKYCDGELIGTKYKLTTHHSFHSCHWYPLTTCRILSMLTCWKLFTVIQVWTCFMYKLLRCCCINFLNCRIVANINILLLHIDCRPSPVLFYLMLKVLKCKEKLTEAYNESCSEIGDINSWAPHTECNASHLNLCRNLLSFIFSAIITVLGTPLIRRNEIFSFLLVC